MRGLDPSLRQADGTRLAPHVAAKLPADTVGAGGVAAGVHLAMVGDASSLILGMRAVGKTTTPAPTVADMFTVWCGDRVVAHAPVVDQVVIELPRRAADDVIAVYLPEATSTLVTWVQAGGGELRPAPSGPRWVAYGDSITQGWSVSDAGRAWPSVVARELGLDLVNLGFAGSARGELPAAIQVSESGADLVTLSWGTNCWSSIPTDVNQIAETMRLFLTVVRQGLPEVPVVVLSPIVRPGAETEPNRFGSTLEHLRDALEATVAAMALTDDHLFLVPGRELVQQQDLVDGVHPGDTGQLALAAALTPVIRNALRPTL
ncbi:MAG: SGNH/GDSL hydrolase family protein [Aeromicrobium sp.]